MAISQPQLKTHHGVLMNVAGHGVFIIGSAGSGKSSFALALLSQGHQLIADDVVEFKCKKDTVIGQCPPLLHDLLHTRELGLISISSVFGEKASHTQHQLDFVVEITNQPLPETTLTVSNKTYSILDHSFPLLVLNTANPASLTQRLLCWLTMYSSENKSVIENDFKQRHHKLMATT